MHDAETQKNVDMVNLNAELSHACSKGDITTVDTTDDGGAILSRPQFWFIGVVANRREQKIAHRIGEEFADVEAYVPVRKEMRTWSRGRKREIEKVVIPAKVFIHSTENQRISILKSNIGVSYLHFILLCIESQRFIMNYTPERKTQCNLHFTKLVPFFYIPKAILSKKFIGTKFLRLDG